MSTAFVMASSRACAASSRAAGVNGIAVGHDDLTTLLALTAAAFNSSSAVC